MISIRTVCDQCGDIELPISDIFLVFGEQDDEEGVYEFVCPYCEEIREKPVNRSTVSILLAMGIQYKLRIQFPKLTEEIISLFAENLDIRDAGSIMGEIERLGH